MEDLLQQIIKEATGNKFAHLRNGAQNAHGTPGDHQSIMPHDSTLYLIQYCVYVCVRRQTAAPARLPSGSVVRAAHRVPDRHADGAGNASAEVRYAGAERHARELVTRLYVCVVSFRKLCSIGTRKVVRKMRNRRPEFLVCWGSETNTEQYCLFSVATCDILLSFI